MNLHTILSVWSLPLIGAFNGWITTHFAIRMLFRPRRPIRIFRWAYVAPLPKRQQEIAERIGAIVENELISYSDIKDQAITPEFVRRIEQAISARIGDILFKRRDAFPSLVRKLLTDEMLRHAQRLLTREIASHLPELIDTTFELLSENVQIRGLIAGKVAAFELQRLEEVVFSLASRELRLIEFFCGGLGFLIGLAQLILAIL